MSDIIAELLEAREENGSIDFNDKELKDKEDFRRKKNEELHDFIEKRVHPCSKKPLMNFIERYINAYCSYYDTEAKLYYKAGFSDAMQIFLTSLR